MASYEFRMAAKPGWMTGTPSNDPSITCWVRFRDGREPDALSLIAIVDAAYQAVIAGSPVA